MFVGRIEELSELEKRYKSHSSQLVVVYGRRRIGKSVLIKEFCKNKTSLQFEGLEREQTPAQIQHFIPSIKRQLKDPMLDGMIFKNWRSVFLYLNDKLSPDKKIILFFDELPWMAAGQGKLISLIKYFWDNYWKDKKVMLILCGSIASFMISKVIKSKALYGRINFQLRVDEFSPIEAFQMLRGKRSREEVLKYLLTFGGIPKYLEEINISRSFDQNLEELCFFKDSIMVDEFEKIFYIQFRESQLYIRIIESLKNRALTIKEISESIHFSSGGGLKSYLQNLENATFIEGYILFMRESNSKFKRYRLIDDYLSFYFSYILPNKRFILTKQKGQIYRLKIKSALSIWFGYAFERFCVKHAFYLAERMGFADQVINAVPYAEREQENKGFQIDLIYERADKVITVCEIKFYSEEIGVEVVREVNRKCSLLKIPRGFTLEKALISLYGPSPTLKTLDFFQHYLTLEDIFNKRSLD
ncbi:MAG: AAA family ATPase [Oligoflexia bacterium]|nr:AAA family ATPase [Oligoflexia bacterium]